MAARDRDDDETITDAYSGSAGGFSDLLEQARRGMDAGVDELTPRYEVGELLGKGGMGEVLAATDRRLRRVVALKRMSATGDVRRFLQEAQVTGQLDHPNIPAVHDIGIGPRGVVYFTMKQLQGRTLTALIEHADTSLFERLRIFMSVCDAVAFAHARGVLHRDLKPSNIMVGEFNEVYVLDWGLAKLVGEPELPTRAGSGPDSSSDSASGRVTSDTGDEPLTRHGALMGTPQYMAPEQAVGEPDEVDARADVYALGAILYVLVTGKRPFRGRGPEMLRRVIEGEFVPPRSRVAGVPPELDAVVLRAMATRADRRYPDVRTLREDIQRFVEGHPVSALEVGPLQRVAKWAGRNRRPLGMAAAVLLAVGTLALAGLGAHTVRVTGARDRALAAERDASLRLADSQVAVARALAGEGRLEEASEHLGAASELYLQHGGQILRSRIATSELDDRFEPPELELRVDQGRDAAVALADSGQELAVWGAEEVRVIGLPFGEVRRVWTVPTSGRIEARFVGERLLVLYPIEGGYRLVDVATDAVVAEVMDASERTSETRRMLSGDGGAVAISDARWGTRVHDVRDGRVHALPTALIHALSHDGSRALGVESAGELHRYRSGSTVWDVHSGDKLLELDFLGHGDIARDGRHYAVQLEDTVRLYDLELGTVVWTAPAPPSARPRFSADGSRLVLMGADHSMWLLDASTGAELGRRTIRGGPSSSHGTAVISGDGQRVITSRDGVVRAWTLEPGPGSAPLMVVSGEARATGIALSPDGLLLATTTSDGDTRLWEWRGRRQLRSLPSARGGSRDAVFSADGTRLLSADHDGRARLWNLVDGTVERALDGHAGGRAMAGAFAGDEVLVLMSDGVVRRHDAGTGAQTGELRGDIANAWHAVASPDGTLLAVTGRARTDPAVEVWDLQAGRIRFKAPDSAAYRAAFRADGLELAVASYDGEPWVFDVATGEHRRVAAPRVLSQSVAFSHDGSLLAMGTYDGRVHLYDTTDYSELQELALLDSSVVDLEFVADSSVLVAAAGDGTVATFDLELGERFASAQGGARRGEASGADWLQLARMQVLRGNWHSALGALEQAEQAGASVPATELARVLWGAGRRADAQVAIERARAEGGAGTIEVWGAGR